MRHVLPYVDNTQSFGISILNYYDLIVNETAIIARAESSIPADILIELELKLLIEKGLKGVDNHHRNLVKGKNSMINSLSNYNIPKSEIARINEAFKSIPNNLKSIRLNEDDAALSSTEQSTSSIIQNNLKADPNVPESSMASLPGMFKSILSGLTEEGSFLGVLHLMLDIVGLLGDFFPPVGVIADVLNGVIYMVRAMNGDKSKYILALISFIAAVIPFGGDILKGLFKTTVAGKTVVKFTADYMGGIGAAGVKTADIIGTTAIHVSDDAISLLASAGPKGTDALTYIAKASKKALPLAKQVLDTFFKDFLGAAVKWIPGIGKPLQRFFASIADMFDKFFKVSTKLADDVPVILSKVEMGVIDKFFMAAAGPGTKMVRNGDKLIIKSSGGRVLGELNSSMLKRVDFLNSRYGPDLASSIGKKFATRTESNIIGFYEQLASSMKHVDSKYGTPFKFGSKATDAFIFSKTLTLFIGKQIAKLMIGVDPDNLSDPFINVIGSLPVYNKVQEKIKEELKNNPKAAYVVPIFDGLDTDDRKVLNDHLQEMAEQFGAADIGDVIYAANREKDDLPKDVNDFFNFGYKDKDYSIEDYEKMRSPKKFKKTSADKAYESNKLKHLRKFKL